MDRNSNTALHLACKHGHERLVKLLIDHGADLTCLNLSEHNPITEAIARGNKEVIVTLLECDRWREALRCQHMTTVSVMDTPVKQLIKRFPDLAKLVLDRCITTNLHTSKQKTTNVKTVSPDSKNLKA